MRLVDSWNFKQSCIPQMLAEYREVENDKSLEIYGGQILKSYTGKVRGGEKRRWAVLGAEEMSRCPSILGTPTT